MTNSPMLQPRRKCKQREKKKVQEGSVTAGGQQGASLIIKGLMGFSHHMTNDLTNRIANEASKVAELFV